MPKQKPKYRITANTDSWHVRFQLNGSGEYYDTLGTCVSAIIQLESSPAGNSLAALKAAKLRGLQEAQAALEDFDAAKVDKEIQ